MLARIALVVSVASFVCSADALAAKVTRGPYLQSVAADSIVVVWRTDEPTDSRVTFGATPQSLARAVGSAERVTQHEVRITGLEPATKYHYAVGTSAAVLAGADASHFFVTSPPRGARTKFRAWVVGDSGTGDARQAAARDAMLRDVGRDRPDLFLHLGDMAYGQGTDLQFQERFFDVHQLTFRNTPVWPTLGNHEGASSDSQTQAGPYYDAFVLPKAGEAGGVPSGTEAYYSFDHANVHFVVLDSHDSPRETDGPMLRWLAQDLAATDQDWVIAFFHHPPYSKGSHDSDVERQLVDMRENALPILEAGGVDLVLAGHSHIYERSFLLDGAYETPSVGGLHVLDSGDGRPLGGGAYRKDGRAAHSGTVYVVAGHGGANLGGPGNHPLMYFTEKEFGSSLLDVDGDRLTLVNVRHDGVRTDSFTMMKAPGLVLASPNGGERLRAGASHEVRWAVEGDTATVRLELSLDGGKTWEALATAPGAAGKHSWTVPARATESASLRIVDASDPDRRDVTDASFAIFEGTDPGRPNEAPAFTMPDAIDGQVGYLVLLQVRAADPDGDALSFAIAPELEGASLAGNTLTWIPPRGTEGIHDVRITASDGRGATASHALQLRIRDESGELPVPPPDAEGPPAAGAGCGCGGSASATAAALSVLSLLAVQRLRRRN